jgi:hypothetical protein
MISGAWHLGIFEQPEKDDFFMLTVSPLAGKFWESSDPFFFFQARL